MPGPQPTRITFSLNKSARFDFRLDERFNAQDFCVLASKRMSGAVIISFLQNRAGAHRQRGLKPRTTGAGMFKIKLAILAAAALLSLCVSAGAQPATQA